MARLRRSYGKRRYSRRRYHRKYRSVAYKALRIAKSANYKLAAEVKKADANQLFTNEILDNETLPTITGSQQFSRIFQYGLSDYGALYPIFTSGDGTVQGIQLDDFIGEQVRTKYLYIGLHLQYPRSTSYTTSSMTSPSARNSGVAGTLPLSIRCILVQDKNFNETTYTTPAQLFANLFGVTNADDAYGQNSDSTLLPINPNQPGRFKVIRDFRMSIAPGWKQDYYKKLYIRQGSFANKGRIYFSDTTAEGDPPGNTTSAYNVSRNALYLLFLMQNPNYTELNGTTAVDSETPSPAFNLSVQTRFAYYDN